MLNSERQLTDFDEQLKNKMTDATAQLHELYEIIEGEFGTASAKRGVRMLAEAVIKVKRKEKANEQT